LFNNLYGVWANKDMELVISEELILKFERKENLFIASLFSYRLNSDSFTLEPKAIAVFDNTNKTMGMKYCDHTNYKIESFGEDLLYKIDFEKRIYKVKDSGATLVLQNVEEEFLTYSSDSGLLSISGFQAGNVSLEKIEELGEINLDSLVYADKNNIGRCLKDWNLGTRYFLSKENDSFSASIRTNKHSYIFRFNPSLENHMVYCRAARMSSTNSGSVFSQNIRMMKNKREFTAYMAEDNLQMAGSELVIDNSQFLKNQCTFSKEGPIYWSLKEFSKDRIVLNGCGGDEYMHTRPESESEK